MFDVEVKEFIFAKGLDVKTEEEEEEGGVNVKDWVKKLSNCKTLNITQTWHVVYRSLIYWKLCTD